MNRLKVLFLSLIAMTFVYTSSYCQVYLGVQGGYNFAQSSILLATDDNNAVFPASTKALYGSLGKGYTFGGTFGVRVNPYVGIELTVAGTFGGSYKEIDTYPTYIVTTTYESSIITVSPTILLSAGPENFTPYVKFGGVFAFPSATITSSGVYHNIKWEFSGNIPIGFTGSFGVMTNVLDWMKIYLEASSTNYSWIPDEESYVNKFTGDNKIFRLEDSVDGSKDDVALAPAFPLSNIGLKMGMLFRL
jgi:hypothetical protein